MFDRFRHWLSPQPAAAVPHATAPTPALQARAQVRQRPPHEAAATGSPRVMDWDPGDVSANAAAADAPTIRRRCRDAVRNDSWARAIVETMVDDVIGWGVKPMSRAQSEPFRQDLQRLHDDWAAVADADGVLDYAGLQALVVRNWLVDGECFIRLRQRKTEDGLPVPLQLQVLPAEVCPDTTQKAPGSSNDIKQGIELTRLVAE